MVGNLTKEDLQLPQINDISLMVDPRMSQITSPEMPNISSMVGHRGPSHNVAAPQMPTAPIQDSQQREVKYINAKQFQRILKRRAARQRLKDHLGLTAGGRKPYLYESWHNHAVRRPRGPDGRFLSAEEVDALKKYSKLPGIGQADDEDIAT